MIITQLIGGLGNQMFQYAAGLSLARQNGMEIRIDKNALQKYKLHQGYQFDQIFSGEFQQATGWEIFKTLGRRKFKAVRRGAEIKQSYKFVEGYPWIRQPTHDYWQSFHKVSSPGYLSGYWQSSKYFANVEGEVRAAFSFREALAGRNIDIANQICAEQSVAIHVRRGDYVLNSNLSNTIKYCDWDYYDTAIETILEKKGDARFYIFSDEPDVARDHFRDSTRFQIVDWNTGIFSYRDMHLMSLSRHHIISNSTFSWWGAWLATHAEQIVIAPFPWFKGSDEAISDIYEPAWIKI
jgi:hypothetical protein